MEIEYIPERPISIYGLICPITNDVKYVGATYDVDRRFKSHLTNKLHNLKMKVWMEELRDLNIIPKCIIFGVFETRSEAIEMELFYIEKYRETLVNGDYEHRLPPDSISSSKYDKYKVSFYLTKQEIETILPILNSHSNSMHWSFVDIIKNHPIKYFSNLKNKIKWINTNLEKQIKI